MRNKMNDRKKTRDSRAKDKRDSKNVIDDALGKIAVAAILALAVMGCNEISDIIVEVEPTEDSKVWSGELTAVVDGVEIVGHFTMIIKPTTEPDEGIPTIPVVPDPDDEAGANADPTTYPGPSAGDVWVTVSGSKYHWRCWRTGVGNGSWVTISETENEPCLNCEKLQAKLEEEA